MVRRSLKLDVIKPGKPPQLFQLDSGHPPPAADDHAELVARARHAVADMELASTLRPEDHRIESWLAGARMHEEKVRTGTQSAPTLTAALDAIAVRPTFNLWTAILLFHDRPSDSSLFARLTDQAKAFVDQMRGGNDPCQARPRDCGNGKRAPYNSQAARVELGDVFLRRAESLLQSGNVPRALEMAQYAKGSYAQLNKPENALETKSWPDLLVLADRVARASSIQRRRLTRPLLAQSDDYHRVYECASCHGR